jgi:hypothetical protein
LHQERPVARPTGEIQAQKMVGLWKRGELTDVVLVASDGRELSAHRDILGVHSQVLSLKVLKNRKIQKKPLKFTHIWLIFQKIHFY